MTTIEEGVTLDFH